MINGTYDVKLKTPMGLKKGQLVLSSNGEQLTGALVALGQESPFEDGRVSGEQFSFRGAMNTVLGRLEYDCTGSVDGDAVSGSVNTKKGVLTFTGKRV